MTTVYIQDKENATQEFNCSDGSTGVLKVEDFKQRHQHIILSFMLIVTRVFG